MKACASAVHIRVTSQANHFSVLSLTRSLARSAFQTWRSCDSLLLKTLVFAQWFIATEPPL